MKSHLPVGRRHALQSESMGANRPFQAFLILLAAANAAFAQDKGTLDPVTLPPLEHPDDPHTPARELFGRKTAPTHETAQAVGFYAAGCLAGGTPLPINGPAWQVMRLSRNRNWGHPDLVHFLENLATKVHKAGTWNGLLVGDMSQPRGGPMFTGHASHQVGLDADIWLTPMPHRELSRAEREEMSATMVVAENRRDVDRKVWTPGHAAVIKAAAEDPEVERIFVNPAIKKALCREESGDRAWLSKVRP
jgi:penicillin-insensitive murein DD-endopeptidase